MASEKRNRNVFPAKQVECERMSVLTSPDIPLQEYLELRDVWRQDPCLYVRQRFGTSPTDQQAQILDALTPLGAKVSVRSGHGIGKAQPKDLILDTPSGRKAFGDLQPGDEVFGADGHPTRVLAVHDQGQLPLYRVVFDDDTSTLTCADHLWATRNRQDRRMHRPWRVVSTQDILAQGVLRPNGVTAAKQWEIPPQAPVVYPGTSLPFDAYTMGVWLGNGSRRRHTVTLNSDDSDHIITRMMHAGLSVTPHTTTNTHACVWGVRGLTRVLKALHLWDCGAATKGVPRIYKENVPQVRAEVLRGLLDTDGYCSPLGVIEFSSASPQLAQDVAWLARSLGGKVHCQPPKPAGYRTVDGEYIACLESHRVHITMPDGFQSFYALRKGAHVRPATQHRYLKRWMADIEPAGWAECCCITVAAPDGLYLTNDFIVTHNSSSAAWSIWWFLETMENAKVPCTAPTSHQLHDILWAELSKWRRRADELSRERRDPSYCWLSRLFRLMNDAVVDPNAREWGAFARTARKEAPESLQGFHAEHLLYVLDEASGIPEEVFEAAEGALSTPNARVLMLGNPTRNLGTFAHSHRHNRGEYTALHFRSQDSPLVDTEYRERLVRKYGEGSNVVRVRADGDFPKQDDDILISLELTEPCTQREPRQGDGIRRLGVDVARLGADRTALVLRQGSVVDHIRIFSKQDTMATVGCILNVLDAWRVDEIAVDVVGLGAGVYDRLAELRRQGHFACAVLAVNVAERAPVVQHPADAKPRLLRDYLWLEMARWLREEAPVFCAEDRGTCEDLAGELASVGYGLDSQGQLVVEDKDHMRKRLGLSPDLADSLGCTFAPAKPKTGVMGLRF